MTYRDDRDALLARLDVQRRELATSRAEIDRLRARIAELEAAHADLSRKLQIWREHYQTPPALAPPEPPAPSQPPTAGELLFQIAEPGSDQARELRLHRDVVKIGRLASSHIKVDDPDVSRMHAVIEVTPEQVMIVDLGSAGGTRVNGSAITKAALASGDLVEVGRTRIRVYFGW